MISNSPVHDAASVATYSPIVLQFSKPMNRNSVETNFGTLPSVSGTFAWSPAGDTMTFTAGGAGLPGLTMMTVRLTNSAIDAISGNALYSPYEMRFKTAVTTFHDTTPPAITVTTPTNAAIIAGNLVISGTATDNIAVQTVEVRLDNSPWLTANGTTAWNYSLNTSNFLNGPHVVAARATDTTGNISTTNTASVRFINVPGSYVQRVSGGNPANVTDCSNNIWLRDTAYSFGAFGYSGGTAGVLANTITGICASAQSLYQRERYSTNSGGFYYEFDCPAGIYETTILEAETYWSGPGKRVFNAFIQGRQVLTNLDIYAAAGGMNKPLTLVFTNAVTNSQLQVLFTEVVDHARISGLQVRKIGDVASDTDGIPDWWRLAYFGHALGSASDNSRASDDADGDGASNLSEFLSGTDPLDPASVFKVIQAATVEADVQVSCSTVPTRTYQLQRRASLDATSSWSNVGQPMPGTGGALVLTDSGGATNSAAYYRVQAQ